MARKSKHEEYDIDEIYDAFSEEEEISIENSSKKVLFDFGNKVSAGIYNMDDKNRDTGSVSPIEMLKKRMSTANDNDKKIEEETEKEIEEKTPDIKVEAHKVDNSLLKKLKRYTTDESGHDVTEDKLPIYTLQSVAEIIKSDSNKLLNKLSEKYDVKIDNLSRKSNDDYLLKDIDKPSDSKSDPVTENGAVAEYNVDTSPTFEEMAKESRQRFEKNLFDELFGERQLAKTETAAETVPDISDIDNSNIKDIYSSEEEKIAATIRFTPVVDEKGNTGRINITSTTKPIDIREELTEAQEAQESSDSMRGLSDFDLAVQKGEVTDILSAKSAVRRLAYKRRRNFLSSVFCALCVFIMSLFFLPLFSDILISSPHVVTVICSLLLFAEIIANFDMFADILKLFKKNAGHDCIVSVCALSCIPLCVYAMINGESIYNMVFLGGIIMFVRCAANYMQTSTLYSNLKQISGKSKKYGVSFIKEDSTALAMSKNAIDGDVLIAAPQRAEFISDYMKFSLFKKQFSGKIPVVFILTMVLCALGAAASVFYYKTLFAALYTVASTTMIAAMPALCFIDVLPLFVAAKKLNKKGAMIAGTFGADKLELANAAVIDTADIFPVGSILLKNIKVLSENNIDRTIVNAAALAEEAGSPLAPVLCKIASTNTSYEKPDSDTIKYEEHLGISGWVDNELLFIGNRSLMQAHGIEVPSIEVDKKILQQSCFPIYVATGGKACALLTVQYKVRKDIQKLLKKISRLGITLLVNNCDPNVNEDMICDYFGIYDDSVKVMTNVGAHMYKSAVVETSILSAPAGFRSGKLSLLRIMSCASGIKTSNAVLSVFYACASIFGIWYFIYNSFAQSGGLLSGLTILTFELLATLFAFIAFLFRKP